VQARNSFFPLKPTCSCSIPREPRPSFLQCSTLWIRNIRGSRVQGHGQARPAISPLTASSPHEGPKPSVVKRNTRAPRGTRSP
jgi:hypothetical protein